MSKSKLYLLIFLHLLFWVLNYLYITNGYLTWIGFDNDSGSLGVAYSYGMFFNAFLFYVQVFWLVPYFFIKHKKATFWLYSLLLLFLITFIEVCLDIKVMLHYELINEHVSFILIGTSIFIQNLMFHILYTVFGFFYRFLFAYRDAERKRQELLKETHKTELKYLKAQLNPHFLFNGINSVYHLIGSNNAMAKNTLLQFSDLLRYQLYESSEQFISLEKELTYLTQFIRMEEIRKGEDISLSYEIDYESSALTIAPLLLTPFVENAFKHISHHNKNTDNKISIHIKEEEEKLLLEVKNTVDHDHGKATVGGVGLVNVKRRLALLYPEKYILDIQHEEDYFKVSLQIKLT